MPVTKGYISDYVPAQIYNIQAAGDVLLTEQTRTLYDWKLNLSNIQTLYNIIEYQIVQAAQTGTIKIYVDDVLEETENLTSNNWAYSFLDVDMSGFSGKHSLKITLSSPAAGMYFKHIMGIMQY